MILPGSSSSSRVKPGGKSLSEKYILFAILFVLIFGTVTMVVLLPRGDDLERIPEVRVREEERVVGAEREERLKKEEDRLEGLINRISQREEKLEKILQRLNDKEEKMDKEPPHRNQYVGDEEVEKKNHGRDVPLDLPQNNIHHDNNFNPKQLKLTEDSQRLAAVRNAMEHAWGNYKKYAWGFDELQPLSRSGKDWLGFGATPVDALSTLWIMGMKDEFYEARDWIRDNLDFSTKGHVSFFETTIRALGGLLSAYQFSKDKALLDKAEDLGTRLLRAFNTESKLPTTTVNLNTGSGASASWLQGRAVLSEIGTVQLEFLYLAVATGKPEYAEPALNVIKHIDSLARPDNTMGLHSLYLNLRSGKFEGGRWSLGALGDSFYEYLMKMYIFTGCKFEGFRRMYEESAQLMHDKVILKSTPSSLTYVAEIENGQLHHKMDHLVCFSGGMFALGAEGEKKERDLQTGKELTATCHEIYSRMETGIAPEIVMFDTTKNDFYVKPRDRHYLLRPETVESFFVLYRVTGDPMYREWGWEVFQAIERHCRVAAGYSGIRDVTTPDVQHDNQQQSFFLAETLKYLYLLFSSSDVVSLDEYVFNTEGHPLPVLRNLGVEYTVHFPTASKNG